MADSTATARHGETTPDRSAELPPASPRENEGHTLAAWFAMGMIMIGVVVLGIGTVMASWPVNIVGIVLCAIGLVGGFVLRRAGKGQPLS